VQLSLLQELGLLGRYSDWAAASTIGNLGFGFCTDRRQWRT